MNPYQFNLPVNLYKRDTQFQQIPMMPYAMNVNPMLLNQYLFAQQMQALQMMMVPSVIPPNMQSNNPSNRTIIVEQGIAPHVKVEATEEQKPQRPVVAREEPPKQLDVEQLQVELRALIRYLSQTENPSQDYINEHMKLLPKVNPQIIPIIIERHQNQKKTKEEQIKFVLRKCFKFLKSKLEVNEVIITPLEMEKRLYKEYFGEDEEMIPFRENSSMKTMNAQYLKKIFLSEKFVSGFREYLEHFDSIWDEENEEKVENMVKQVVKLIQQNRIEKLYTYRRIPWIVSIREKCKQLALAMLNYAPNQKSQFKHLKIDLNDIPQELAHESQNLPELSNQEQIKQQCQ